MKANSHSIDALIENFDPSKHDDEEKGETDCVTFWIPLDLKEKYDRLQKQSRQKFGKLLKKVVEKSIEKAKSVD